MNKYKRFLWFWGLALALLTAAGCDVLRVADDGGGGGLPTGPLPATQAAAPDTFPTVQMPSPTLAVSATPVVSPTPFASRTPRPTPSPTATRPSLPTPTPPEEAILPSLAGQVVQLERWGNGRVNHLAWSANGQMLAAASSVGIYIYNPASLALEQTLASDTWFSTAVFSPNNRLLAASSGAVTYVWQMPEGTLLQTIAGQGDSVTALAFDPTSATLAVASGARDTTIRLWDPQTGTLSGALRGPKDGILSIAFRPDSAQFAAGDENATIWLWDLPAGTLQGILQGHAGPVTALAYLPGSKGLVSASAAPDNTIKTWDLALGRAIQTLSGHQASVTSLAVHPDGRLLASGGGDRVIRFWDLSNGLLNNVTEELEDWVRGLAFSPNGRSLASATYQGLRLWETGGWSSGLAEGEPTASTEGHLSWVAGVGFTPEGRLVAVESYANTLRVWDVFDQAPLRTLAGHVDILNAAAFAPDGTWFLSTGADRTARAWSLLPGQLGEALAVYPEQNTAGWSVAAGPVPGQAAVGSFTEIRSYPPGEEIPKNILAGHASWVTAAAFSHDGLSLASGSYQEAWIWNPETGARTMQLSGQLAFPGSMAFSPDDQLLAVGGGAGDPVVRVYQAASGRGLFALAGHSDMVAALAFHPSAPILASGSKDGTVRLWDLETGVELATLTGHTLWVNTLAFSRDGRTLVSGSVDGTVRIWGIAP